MPKRTTIIFEDQVYEMLVKESIRRYGNTKNISRLVNELVKRQLNMNSKEKIARLLSSKKYARISVEEFTEFRRQLSRRFEE